MALRRSAAILEALRSAAAEEEEEDEVEEGSGRTGPAWEGFSTGGAGWRRRAAAVEALVRGPILEKSLKGDKHSTICIICGHRTLFKFQLFKLKNKKKTSSSQ